MNFEGIIGGNSRLNKGVTKIALIFAQDYGWVD
jgi:hypothetical protein